MITSELDRGSLLGQEIDEPRFSILDLILIAVIVLLIANILVQSYWLSPVKVDGESMMQTLQNEDWLFMDKLKKPERGDVVVFKYSKEVNYIKRIIGLPGDTVYSVDGVLYILEEGETEGYAFDDSHAYYMPGKPQGIYQDLSKADIFVEVGEGEIYVLGDNRWGSRDSREIGTVKIETVIGIVPEWAIEKKERYSNYLNFIEKVNLRLSRVFNNDKN